MRHDDELLKQFPWLANIVVEVSTEVADNVTAGTLPFSVVDGSPRRRVIRWASTDEFDAVFTVFGPDYGKRRAPVHIVGFADGLSLNPSMATMRGRRRVKFEVRRLISRSRFRAADRLVVEAEHVRNDLVSRWGMRPDVVDVVPNVLNGAFVRQVVTLPDASAPTGQPKIAYPTRAYPHKNLAMLGKVGDEMLRRHGFAPSFQLTLTETEWSALDDNTRAHSHNHGPLTVRELAGFYAGADAVIFPSLIESFSITPLEAAAAGRPLLASRREFVSGLIGDDAMYFEPTSVSSVTDAVEKLRLEWPELAAKAASARRTALNWPTARDRALSYVAIVDRALANK